MDILMLIPKALFAGSNGAFVIIFGIMFGCVLIFFSWVIDSNLPSHTVAIFGTTIGLIVCLVAICVPTYGENTQTRPVRQICKRVSSYEPNEYIGDFQNIDITHCDIGHDINGNRYHIEVVHHQLPNARKGVNIEHIHHYWVYKNKFDKKHYIIPDDSNILLGKSNMTSSVKRYYVPKNIKMNVSI